MYGSAGADEFPFPEPRAGIPLQPGPFRGGENFGDDRTVAYHPEIVVAPGMKHVHRRGVAVLHLERPQIDRVVVFVKIKKQLRGFLNGTDRFRRVEIAVQKEIGQRLEIIQIRTGETEKISEHLIGEPGG